MLLLQGIAGMRWKKPTKVQEKAIPYMLAGKNVVAQARTGSGKTGAFLVPCLHRTLIAKASAEDQVTYCNKCVLYLIQKFNIFTYVIF